MIKTLHLSKHRHATWLELFFDLVFVAVVGAISHDLSHTHHGHIDMDQLLRFPLVFIPVWWVWATHTLYANCFDTDDRTHRFFALVIMGLLVLADLIGYSIKEDLDPDIFRLIAIAGMGGFYLGKQLPYYVCFPPFRCMIIVNTVVCLSITVASTHLPRIEYSLIGMACGMLFYVYSTYKWLLPNNIDAYIEAHGEHTGA